MWSGDNRRISVSPLCVCTFFMAHAISWAVCDQLIPPLSTVVEQNGRFFYVVMPIHASWRNLKSVQKACSLLLTKTHIILSLSLANSFLFSCHTSCRYGSLDGGFTFAVSSRVAEAASPLRDALNIDEAKPRRGIDGERVDIATALPPTAKVFEGADGLLYAVCGKCCSSERIVLGTVRIPSPTVTDATLCGTKAIVIGRLLYLRLYCSSSLPLLSYCSRCCPPRGHESKR